uniref:Uncharacterized protein n=1 Tax=Nelumbo nucifera TaxID=4432 RepID=A0A822ZWE1_NELNU|nr:TPA_asm: hypothetical protein HUJ06_017143 [Nelumbo nucifera]
MPTRDRRMCAFRTPPAPYEKSKSLGSGGSMVARLNLKELTEGHHQEWSLRLNFDSTRGNLPGSRHSKD